MNSLRIINRTISTHPLTRASRLKAWQRFLKWQFVSRVTTSGIVVAFIEHSKLIVKRSMHGATGNIYTGLQEFEDMAFLLHYLREDELMYDIGANVGSYTILSSANVGARVVAVEPIPSTFYWLKMNCSLNNVESRVILVNSGLGIERGQLKFTSSFDTVNHVVINEEGLATVEVPVTTLDQLVSETGGEAPVLLKMDVEGYEMNVLKGGSNVLSSERLQVLIVEINGCCTKYGVSESQIHEAILEYGFMPVSYNPLTRSLNQESGFKPQGNTIYVRNISNAQQRLRDARKFKVLNRSV